MLDKWHPGKMALLQTPNPQSGTPDGGSPAGGTAGPNPFRSTADPVTGEFFPTTVSDGAYISSSCLSLSASLQPKKQPHFLQQSKAGELVLLCHI